MSESQEDTRTYGVVVNDEQQYSIWPQGRELPAGWRLEGTTGPKQDCLARIGEVWTDMRPLSLRKRMELQTG
jgi:MbtH protein